MTTACGSAKLAAGRRGSGFRRRPIAFADQVADDHQPGGDPDARLELDRFDIEATDKSMTPRAALA
jgi:hypothetical protein